MIHRDFGWRGMVLIAVASLVLVGCGSETETSERSDEEIVMQRAEVWWGALMERDFDTAWEYMTPGFRQATSREQYVAQRQTRSLRYLDAEVIGAECEEATCKVSLNVTYQPVGAPAGIGDSKMMRTTTEQWIRIDGEWWRPAPE